MTTTEDPPLPEGHDPLDESSDVVAADDQGAKDPRAAGDAEVVEDPDAIEEVADEQIARPGPIRSGRHLDKLAELDEERRYLLRSLRDLERERAAGDVDDEDYEVLKDGYTVRAAAVIRQIDEGRRQLPPKRNRNWKRTLALVAAAVVVTAGISVALGSAFGERGVNQEITGFSPADELRTTLVDARAALNRGDFARANQLYLRVDQDEIGRGNDSAEARTYVGWTFALLARQAAAGGDVDPDALSASLLALDQAIQIDPTYADPYCFTAIIEYNFRGDADAALPFLEQCEGSNPPADIAGLITSFGEEIRANSTP